METADESVVLVSVVRLAKAPPVLKVGAGAAPCVEAMADGAAVRVVDAAAVVLGAPNPDPPSNPVVVAAVFGALVAIVGTTDAAG